MTAASHTVYRVSRAVWSPRDDRSHYVLLDEFGSITEARRFAKRRFPAGGYAIERVMTTAMEVKDAADWLAETA